MVDEVQGETTETTETTAADAPADTVGGGDALDDATLLGGEAAKDEGDQDDPAEDKGDEAKPEGAPEAYDLKAPDGQAFDTDAFAVAEPVIRDLNLSNEQAQKLVDVYPQLIERVTTAQRDASIAEIAAVRAGWARDTQADEEIGGPRLDRSKAMAAKAMDVAEVGQPFRDFLNESGLGNHPEMIRALARLGAKFGEDTTERGSSAPTPLSREEKFYGRRAG